MPQTPLIKSLSTILRDEKTSLDDFIFQTDRLSRLLAEFALDFVFEDMFSGGLCFDFFYPLLFSLFLSLPQIPLPS